MYMLLLLIFSEFQGLKLKNPLSPFGDQLEKYSRKIVFTK